MNDEVYKNMSDEALVSRVIDGDGYALEYLLCSRYARLFSFIAKSYLNSNDSSLMNDLRQEVSLALMGSKGDWKPLHDFRGASSLYTYLSKIVRSVCLKMLSKEIDKPHDDLYYNSTDENVPKNPIDLIADDTDAPYDRERRNAMFLEAVCRLQNPEYRLVLFLTLRSFDQDRIAEILQARREKMKIQHIRDSKPVRLTRANVANIKKRALMELKPEVVQLSKEWSLSD